MFGTDCCDVVVQVFVCCLQESRVVFVDFCDTNVLLVGTSMGLYLISGLNHMSFRSIFLALFPTSFFALSPPNSVELNLPR